MSVTVRRYKRGGWEVDLRITLPDGSEHRQRRRCPLAAKSAAQRWGEDRERHWYQELTTRPQASKQHKEVPTLRRVRAEVHGGHARANRQKPSGVASKETILRMHLLPALVAEARRDQERRYPATQVIARGKAPKTVNNVLSVLNMVLKKAVAWQVIEIDAVHYQGATRRRSSSVVSDFDEYERLVEAARDQGWRTHLIVLLGAEAGLRAVRWWRWSGRTWTSREAPSWDRRSDWRGKSRPRRTGACVTSR